jgi:hypothetical protein
MTKPAWFSDSMGLSALLEKIWQHGQVAFNGHSLTGITYKFHYYDNFYISIYT